VREKVSMQVRVIHKQKTNFQWVLLIQQLHVKNEVEEWKRHPTCLSPDKPTKKPLRGMPGINGNMTGGLLREVRPVHVFITFVETDFWLYLRAQVKKYAGSIIVQNDSGYSNSSMESKWFDTMVDELKAFTSLCVIQSCVKKDTLQAYWST